MKKQIAILAQFLALTLLLSGCEMLNVKKSNSPIPTLPAMAVITPTDDTSATPSPSSTPVPTPSVALSPTPSPTPSISPSPTNVKTPSPSPNKTPTPTPSSVAPVNPINLSANSPLNLDLNRDGKKETLTIVTKSGLVTISLKNSGGKEATLSLDNEFVAAYLYRTTAGKACVLLSTDRSGDDYITSVYQLDFAALKFEKTCSIPGYILSMTNTKASLFTYVHVLGIWDANREVTLSSAFVLSVSGDKLCHITGPNRQLSVKKALPVKIMKNGSYISATLTKGTRLRITATDEKTYLLFKLSDSRYGKLSFTVKDSAVLIGGKPESEWFDGILHLQ